MVFLFPAATTSSASVFGGSSVSGQSTLSALLFGDSATTTAATTTAATVSAATTSGAGKLRHS